MNRFSATQFGPRYRILAELGAGGIGNVYKVHDTVKDEDVAIKELSRAHVKSAAAILRFKNEFRIMSEFRHPKMVRVFSYGMSNQHIPYIVMELVPGEDLSQRTENTSDDVVNILLQICQALAVIHSRLYVHRDLKPDNIKCLPDDSIKLLDYSLMSQLGVSMSGKISGTAFYLAPEAIVGGILDESTDLYSLGVIGYELLTGQRPFTGTQREILQQHIKQVPLPPVHWRSDVPAVLNNVIVKLLKKDQQQRYRTCAGVVGDLRYLAGTQNIVDPVELATGYVYGKQIVGRDAELSTCTHALQNLKLGRSATPMFIGSPAGMGKTRLLREMNILAELEEIRTVYTESQASGGGVYGGIDALLQALRSVNTEEVFLWDNGLLSQTPPPAPETVAAAVAPCLTKVTERMPLVLFCDDLHWMDLKSVQVLNELLRQHDAFRALIVGSFRNDEVEKTSPLWHTIEESISAYLELAPLTRPQTRILVEHMLSPSPVSAEFIAYCFQNSGGNVFDLIEFLRYLIAEGHLTKSGPQWQEPVNIEALSLPANLEERVFLRLRRLDDNARVLAEAAAVLGAAMDLESWQAVSGSEEESFFEGLDAVIRHQILLKTGADYRFAHDKIQAALYDQIEPSQKADYHRKAAAFLQTRLTDTRQDLLPVIARHAVAAGDPQPAIEFSLKAGQSAERNQAEWDAFDHYRDAARILEGQPDYANRDALLLGMYEKAAQFSSAAWIDAATCLRWLQQAIDVYAAKQNVDKVFGLSLSYIVNSSISGNYQAARQQIPHILSTCNVQEGSLSWAILYGAGVCLTDWYQGHQRACFAHAVAAIEIFEQQLDSLPNDAWSPYSWALFWRDKARAYLGQPVDMTNVEKIRQLKENGKSDSTIYWHTLTAVTARAAFTGRWDDLLEWKDRASQLSRAMGKIYWFECWISHSYLYGALHHGELSQLDGHIARVQASPDPYQVRLAYLFRGVLQLQQYHYPEAERSLLTFLDMEHDSPDNSYLEGFVYLAQTYLALDSVKKATIYTQKGLQLATEGVYENPLYHLQCLQLQARIALRHQQYAEAEALLRKSLELAQEQENPLQTGYVRMFMGILFQGQRQLDEAGANFQNACESFRSIGNKYRARQAEALLEAMNQGQVAPIAGQRSALSRTPTVVSEDSFTHVDAELPEPEDAQKAVATDAKTVVEDDELDNTVVEDWCFDNICLTDDPVPRTALSASLTGHVLQGADKAVRGTVYPSL